MKISFLIRISFLYAALLVGCGMPTPRNQPNDIGWNYIDLRAIDPPDSKLPSQDLIAAYVRTRNTGRATFSNNSINDISIRFDFLDLAIRNNFDLYLAIDHFPGGSNHLPLPATTEVAWDTLLIIPAAGPIQILDHTYTPRQFTPVTILRDPTLDTVEIHLNTKMLNGINTGFRLQAFVTQASQQVIVDTTRIIASESPPPPPVHILLAFSNTMPAYTPAQAMRRWDGAHTGPFGARHGLYNLLRTARDAQIPLVLLDLKNPASLAAIDYAGGLPLVQTLSNRGLLILPEVGPLPNGGYSQDTIERMLNASHETARVFMLGSSHFAYTPINSALPGPYAVLFTHDDKVISNGNKKLEPSQIHDWQGVKVIKIPNGDSDLQVDSSGPTLQVRRSLIEAAQASRNFQNGNSPPFLILGGELPNSAWGDPRASEAAFRYIDHHPWIKVLNAHDLQSLKPHSSYTPPVNNHEGEAIVMENLLSELIKAPENIIKIAAWDTLYSLFAPLYPQQPQLEQIRAHYSGQVGALVNAASWAERPQPISDCSQDLDLDGQSECILASENVFTGYEPETGVMIWAFIRDETQTHQLIGPSSELILGQSAAENWDLNRGLQADPEVIPGITTTSRVEVDQFSLNHDQINFVSKDGSWTYYLKRNGFSMNYRSTGRIELLIPIIVDPWQRFIPGWGQEYTGKHIDDGALWQHSSGPTVRLKTMSPITVSSFTDTRELMGRKENPNYDYPPGHYLPFPLSLVEISEDQEIDFEITLTSP